MFLTIQPKYSVIQFHLCVTNYKIFIDEDWYELALSMVASKALSVYKDQELISGPKPKWHSPAHIHRANCRCPNCFFGYGSGHRREPQSGRKLVGLDRNHAWDCAGSLTVWMWQGKCMCPCLNLTHFTVDVAKESMNFQGLWDFPALTFKADLDRAGLRHFGLITWVIWPLGPNCSLGFKCSDRIFSVLYTFKFTIFSRSASQSFRLSTTLSGTRNPQLLFLRQLATIPVSLQMHNGDYVCECFYLLVLHV